MARDEHLSERQLKDFTVRRLAPPMLLAAARHLGECRECRAQLDNLNSSPARIPLLEAELTSADYSEPSHLDYEKLEAYVDDCLNEVDRDIVDNHLAFCSGCSDEVSELVALRDEIARHAAGDRAAVAAPGPWRRVEAWIKRFGNQWPVRIAAAALLIVVAGAGWLTWRLIDSPRGEVAKSLDPQTQGNAPSDSGANSNDGSAVVESSEPQPTAGTTEVALEDNGMSVRLDGKGNLSGLPSMDAELAGAVRQVLKSRQVPVSHEIAALAGKPSNLMGESEGESFKLSSPVATVVSDDRPTFRWQRLKGASGYTVAVLDEGFNVVAASGPLTSTTWTPKQQLARGKTYLWQVTAQKDGRSIIAPQAPAREARFKILSAAGRREFERAKQGYSESHLILGTLYAKAGLLDDAEQEFRALLKLNPQSAIVKRLLISVAAQRR